MHPLPSVHPAQRQVALAIQVLDFDPFSVMLENHVKTLFRLTESYAALKCTNRYSVCQNLSEFYSRKVNPKSANRQPTHECFTIFIWTKPGMFLNSQLSKLDSTDRCGKMCGSQTVIVGQRMKSVFCTDTGRCSIISNLLEYLKIWIPEVCTPFSDSSS